MDILLAHHLRKVYNTFLGARQCVAIDDVSFGVEQGEFVAVMGPSGSGKTTLLNLLASLDKPTSGEIYLEGISFREISNRNLAAFRREKMGFVFQDFNLLDTFTVKDNILLPLVLSNTKLNVMEQRLQPLAEKLGLTPLLNKFPYEISGGEKQRTAIARAVITQPRILLADEPTGALDSRSSAKLLATFTELNQQGQTILMVTHSSLAASYASRVMFIKDGRIYNQIYRGQSEQRQFFDQIIATLSLLLDGGGDIG